MSDSTETGRGTGSGEVRTPDQYIKRSTTLSTSTAIGTAGSSAALVALYINECLTAGAWVVPSTEMILVLLGLLAPVVHLIWRVGNAKLQKWAAASGVSLAVVLGLLSGCASDGGLIRDGEHLDKKVTLAKACQAVTAADLAFVALVVAKPDLVTTNGQAVERAIMKIVAPVCAEGYRGDLDQALRTAVSALVQITIVMQGWEKGD